MEAKRSVCAVYLLFAVWLTDAYYFDKNSTYHHYMAQNAILNGNTSTLIKKRSVNQTKSGNGLQSPIVDSFVQRTHTGTEYSQRRKRDGFFNYYKNCPRDISKNALPGQLCAVVTWDFSEYSDSHSGGNSGDCFPEGKSTVTYKYKGSFLGSWLNGDTCTFSVTVTVLYCPLLPSILPNGVQICTGAKDNINGGVCILSCNNGYKMNGASVLKCEGTKWNSSRPTCEVQYCNPFPRQHPFGSRSCTSNPGNVYRSVCTYSCDSGFILRGASSIECKEHHGSAYWSTSYPQCHVTTPPILSTCQVYVTDSQGHDSHSGYKDGITSCNNQCDEWIKSQLIKLHYTIKAFLKHKLPNYDYIHDSKFGIVGAKIALKKYSFSGTTYLLAEQILNNKPFCQEKSDSTNPVIGGQPLDCTGIFNLTLYGLNLVDGESLCAEMEAFSGGYYAENLQEQIIFEQVSREKKVCFLYDDVKPIHYSDDGSNTEPLKLSSRITQSSSIEVLVEGWLDPVPEGGSFSASQIEKYKLDVHRVLTGVNPLKVEDGAIPKCSKEWNATRDNVYNITMTLPDENPHLYAILLEVHDYAGNVQYARRLVMFDNSSSVKLLGSKSLKVTTADPRSTFLWQTDINRNMCIDWQDRFYNSGMYVNNFLLPVSVDYSRNISGHYDQISGLLPVHGTNNLHGVVKFELSWSRDGGNRSMLINVLPLHDQKTCFHEQLADGETYDIWIRATDIMNNFQEDHVRVRIDHTPPFIKIWGLRGRFGRNGLDVHNSTNLQKMMLEVEVLDPHSGIKTIEWTLGTSDRSANIGHQAISVQNVENGTMCSGITHCYLIMFNKLVQANTNDGIHHQDYYIAIIATNHAGLPFTESFKFLVDASPPSVGIILEGLVEEAEMDFTSDRVLHLRWHGFLDHESGILLYRIVLSGRCLTEEEMDAADNATEVENGNMVSMTFPYEGHFYTSIVAYNGAMEPSEVACSDGIIYDTTPPLFSNVTIKHARTRESLGCTYSGQVWLINTNLTRVRLSQTLLCSNICASNLSYPSSIEHITISSIHFMDRNVSDDLCQTLHLITEGFSVMLPSDYLFISWEVEDKESEMEEFYIGIGTDRTTQSAPDLLPFVATHRHHLYYVRHSGLGHGLRFFIFLQALTKAGLYAYLTLGPFTIDVTPPNVKGSLKSVVDSSFFIATWTHETFSDTEQPAGVDFEITYRIGYEDTFITPFQSLSTSSFTQCRKYNATRCVQYPVSALHAYDTDLGRFFFFQLHVTNAAGHMVTVNSSASRLPAHLPPSHAVVFDIARAALVTPGISDVTTMKAQAVESSPSSNCFDSTKSSMESKSLDAQTSCILSQTTLRDVDVILETFEVCVAWSGFYHEENIQVQIGIGTVPDSANLITFITAQKSPKCVNVSNLPVYTKLFSLVKATNPGGTKILSSDGFYIIPKNDPQNKMMVFNGRGCTKNNNIRSDITIAGHSALEISIATGVTIHPGDLMFLHLSPFIERVTFQNAILLQTTLSGYQIIAIEPNITMTLPIETAMNITMEVQNCLKDAIMLPVPKNHVSVSWEMFGPWTKFCKALKVELLDISCMQKLPKKDKFSEEQCLAAKEHIASTSRRLDFKGLRINPEHTYTSLVSACFDDGCIPTSSVFSVIYHTIQQEVVIENATLLRQVSEYVEVKIEAVIQPFINISEIGNWSLSIFRWTIARDASAILQVTGWKVVKEMMPNILKVQDRVYMSGSGKGTLYGCVQPLYPWKAEYPTCRKLFHSSDLHQGGPFHIIELTHDIFRMMDFDEYLHSHQLGDKLHDIHDLDIDFARGNDLISAVLTYSAGRNVTWFLTMLPRVPQSGVCAKDSACISEKVTQNGTVIFSRVSQLLNGQIYFVCVLMSVRSSESRGQTDLIVEMCGDGVIIDNTPPVKGEVIISNSDSGYLSESDHVLVIWSGFFDIEMEVDQLPDDNILNYSVSLGSYLGAEDIAHFVSVGQRTTWVFEHLNLTPGISCIATVKAQDRVGLITTASSSHIIVDNTPPSKGYVAAGKITQEKFVSGPDVPVHWEGVDDQESGVRVLEVGIGSPGTTDDVIPFQHCTGTSATLFDSPNLLDGHSYIVLLKATNGAGLTTLMTSEPFIVDKSPPGIGVVWNGAANKSDHKAFSTEIGVYQAYWAGFSDPHSGLASYRVGLGSYPGETDIRPLIYIGLQTSYQWIHEFEQGKQYYITLQVCNHAGLCRVTSSSSLTYDNSPPTIGVVTVGFDGRHNKFVGHSSSLCAQWTGFSDPQTGIEEFFWCVGMAPGLCDITSFTPTMLSRSALGAGFTLPVATPLFVTVRARNPAGLETVSVSDSFIVDLTPPEVQEEPYFLSPQGRSSEANQMDRSVLHLAWKFSDPDSSVVTHTINIRSHLTGHLITNPVKLPAVTELTLLLVKENFLLDGDKYWASVTACNAASLCTTATSAMLLIDSTPPFVGTIQSPLLWKLENITQDGGNKTIVMVVNITWWKFSDPESGIAAYYITAGKKYNGEELSGGKVRVIHDNSTQNQTFSLGMTEILTTGDDIYIHIWAENTVGLYSPIARMAFDVLQESANRDLGSLVLIRHSCDIGYCTNECTCAPTGQVCKANFTLCQELDFLETNLGSLIYPYIGFLSKPISYTTSAKCLLGHWNLSNQNFISNISRFEWSFSLANMSAGEGVFSLLTEANWYDVGHDMHIIFCLPHDRILMSRQQYVLHVRVWLSNKQFMTFLSEPILVDHSPPQIRRGKSVIECNITCANDIDYTTESIVTACWGYVFSDVQSNITSFEVWVGTSQYADDYIKKTDIGLNTSFEIPTNNFQEGTRYYVTVRAWNGVGLQTTAVSDGVAIDVSAPVTGVFATDRINNHQYQSSTTSLLASWHGFEDRYSGIQNYHLAVYDVKNNTPLVATFPVAGFKTEILLQGLKLEHMHSYQVVLYAQDKVGWKSKEILSLPVVVDTTPPEGIICKNFQLEDTKFLKYLSTYSFLYDTYSTVFKFYSASLNEMLKIVITAANLEVGAAAYIGVDELQMPLYFVYGKLGNATAEHILLLPSDGNKTLQVVVEANSGTQLTAQLYRCFQTEKSNDKAVTIHQLSQRIISVCIRILDSESAIRSLFVGVGTTKGGLQVQPLIPVGHSSQVIFEANVQHGAPLYATAIAENYAGLWARFISQPIDMDRTAPVVSDVTITLTYVGEEHVNKLQVWAEAEWNAEDKESNVDTCTCQLEGQLTIADSLQVTSDVTPGRCRWLLKQPQHGAYVHVVVSCINKIQIHSTQMSQPKLILLKPPDLSEAKVMFLSNNAFVSPFDWSDPEVLSANSSLEIYWCGLNDPTITAVQYRLRYESHPLVNWSVINTYKTSAILEMSHLRLPSGKITAEVKAFNSRLMASDVVSATILLNDSKPYLSGKAASLMLKDGQLVLDWKGVFNVSHGVTYSVFAGTAPGYGDVINHVLAKDTSFQTQNTTPVTDVYVTIKAVYPNGLWEIYQATMKL